MHNARFHPSILREYDIRGIMGQTLFEKDAYWIGRCFGHVVKEKAGKAIAVARDGRLSSPQLESSLMKGLCDAGLDVYHLEIGPTPMLYFAEYTLPVDAAIMVTGSHNPPSHNGFKMSLQRKPFFGKDIAAFSQLITESLHKGQGKIYASNLLALYIDRLLQNLQLADKLKVVWDSGNGATGDILKNLIPQLPGHHILLNAEIDGNFPAHPPDPSDPVNLRELQRGASLHLDVRRSRARESGQHRGLSPAGGGGLLRQGRKLRPAQPAREPARRVPELAPDLRDLLQRRRSRLRHREPVPATRDRVLRAAESGADDGSAPQSAAGDPVVRLLRRPERADVSHGPQRRPEHPSVRGAVRSTIPTIEVLVENC